MAVSAPGTKDLPEVEQPQLRRRGSSFPPPESGFLQVDSDDETQSEDSGYPESAKDAAKTQPAVVHVSDMDGGMVWHAKVFTDDYRHPRDCDKEGNVKPRRPMPVIRASDLLSQLTKQGDCWILPGPLNDWPSLVNLQLRSITMKPRGILPMMTEVKRIWKEGDELPKELPGRCRATFLAPSWMKKGWSPDSPGFLWWFTPQACQSAEGPGRCSFGELLVPLAMAQYADVTAVRAHAIAHRYPVESETLRDQQTWHVAVALEWSHGQFLTLVELAWLNGIGGYGGKSNWVKDKLEKMPEIYRAMTGSMCGSWNSSMGEIRMIDMPIKTKDELQRYLNRYSEGGELAASDLRFKAPVLYASAEVRLRLRAPGHIAGYLLNYINAVPEYETLRKNCQTFGTDLFTFLTGRKDVKPFTSIVQPFYSSRTDAFLYA